jgi:hypothetical protein
MFHNLREKLNYEFHNNTLGLPKHMTIEDQILLDKNISDLIFTEDYFNKTCVLNNKFDMSIFYNAFENGVNY